ncbi:MAG: DUF3421 domain-containing protein [Candidatus Latescibacteria bacterium]|nr:DUF3421 domain-containing protein [Candidatus Latescibacterota bacterium]
MQKHTFFTTRLAAGVLLVAGLTCTTLAVAQSDWPATFDGVNSMGPYAWVDGPTALRSDPQLTNGVYGGQVGNLRLAVCRASFQDGVHPGKYFNGQCNVSWGGKEVARTTDYQVLVNTQPQNAKYLTQRWNAAGEGFVGGNAGNTPLRVCQTWAADGTHLGKVWEGKCYYGWGGVEKADAAYGMLFLDFDKAAWQAAQNPLVNATTITIQPVTTQDQNTQVIYTNTGSPTPLIDPQQLYQLFQQNTANIQVGINWAPGSLGSGFNYVATYLPNLTYLMIDHYNITCTDPAQRRDRAEMYQAVRQGEVRAQAAMVLVMSEFAKSILNRNPATWTSEEKSYVQFLLALITDQRKRAGEEAQKNFRQWEYEEIGKRTSEGLVAMIDPLVNPPPEILAMAKAGYAVTPENVENYMAIIQACAAPIAAGIGAGSVGVLAAIGAGATIAGAISPSVKIAISIGGSVGRAALGMGSLAAGVAVVAIMIEAAIVKGEAVVKYEEYKVALNQAIAESTVPMTAERLRPLLDTEDGMKSLGSWLAAQAATGTAH